MGKTYRIMLAENAGEWIEVEKVRKGVYRMVADSMTVEGDGNYHNTNLGIREWDEEVVDLDNGRSDGSQCFGISEHLRWNDVDFTTEEFRAPSIKRLLEALSHVTFTAWCPGDI
ncbi:MAG: hypothetical protein HY226_03995 [Candidatus Vogelbacteria bacterium]|nr:hypothetical protein [Candidatus Vogelbacteria bacterium]